MDTAEHALDMLLTYFQDWHDAYLFLVILVLIVAEVIVGEFRRLSAVVPLIRTLTVVVFFLCVIEIARRYLDDVALLPLLPLLPFSVVVVFSVSLLWLLFFVVSKARARARDLLNRYGKARTFRVVSFEKLNTGAGDYVRGIVRLSMDLMNELGVDRGSLIAITGRAEKLSNDPQRNWSTIFRVVRGIQGGTKFEDRTLGAENYDLSDVPVDRATIGLEYDDRSPIWATQDRASLKLRRARIWNWFHYLWSHTDVLTKINFRTSVALFLLGIAIGVTVGR